MDNDAQLAAHEL